MDESRRIWSGPNPPVPVCCFHITAEASWNWNEKVTQPDQSSSRPCTQAGKGLMKGESSQKVKKKTQESSQPQFFLHSSEMRADVGHHAIHEPHVCVTPHQLTHDLTMHNIFMATSHTSFPQANGSPLGSLGSPNASPNRRPPRIPE